MKNLPRWMPWIAAAGVLAGAGVAGAWRSAPAPLAAPASVGVIRLGSLMDGLTEAKEKGAALEARRQTVVAGLRELEAEIQALQAQIASDTLQGEALFNAAQDMSEKQAFGQARMQAAQTRLDIARGDMMRELYEKVVAACGQFAENNGYDMILVDDRSFPLAEMTSSTAEHQAAIRARRVLYARASMDVTDQVLTLMNNAYAQNAAGGAPQ
jgi:Skp family chaperone for outer membrane proteins